jgi:hypothetical protein
VRRAALVLGALALAGCETTAEKSARLKRAARHAALAQTGLSISRTSTQAEVVGAVAVRGEEGTAIVVTVRNTTERTLEHVPISVTLKDASGRILYRNDAPGLEAGLVSVGSLAPHQTLSWVDDQLPPGAAAGTVDARLGESASSRASPPTVRVSEVHPTEDPSAGAGASGTVSNGSATAQRLLVVYAVGRRAGKIVAAGRAVVPELAGSSAAHFQLFLLGQASGAKLQVASPATTLR